MSACLTKDKDNCNSECNDKRYYKSGLKGNAVTSTISKIKVTYSL